MAATKSSGAAVRPTGEAGTMTISEESAVHMLDVLTEVQIAAPVATVWASLLEEIGPGFNDRRGPMSMRLEPWPGGRWFRDLGNNTGHLWGHVQVIKPPPHDRPLLEITGPMFMSYPTASHVQYRLAPEGDATRVTLRHRAIGLLPKEHREGVKEGWDEVLGKVKKAAEKR